MFYPQLQHHPFVSPFYFVVSYTGHIHLTSGFTHLIWGVCQLLAAKSPPLIVLKRTGFERLAWGSTASLTHDCPHLPFQRQKYTFLATAVMKTWSTPDHLVFACTADTICLCLMSRDRVLVIIVFTNSFETASQNIVIIWVHVTNDDNVHQ